MTALAAPKTIEQMNGPDWLGPCPVKANAVIYNGALLVKTTGDYATPATAAGSLIVLGVADLEGWQSDAPNGQGPAAFGSDTREKLDNTGGADGAVSVICRRGVFRFKNKAGDLVDATMVGENCSIEDDQTVRATAAGSSVAGLVVGMAQDGSGDVYVQVGGYGEAL